MFIYLSGEDTFLDACTNCTFTFAIERTKIEIFISNFQHIFCRFYTNNNCEILDLLMPLYICVSFWYDASFFHTKNGHITPNFDNFDLAVQNMSSPEMFVWFHLNYKGYNDANFLGIFYKVSVLSFSMNKKKLTLLAYLFYKFMSLHGYVINVLSRNFEWYSFSHNLFAVCTNYCGIFLLH